MTPSSKKSAAPSATVNLSSPEGRRAAARAAMAGVVKEFGDGAIYMLGENKALNVEVTSTGSLAVDIAIGVGGLPKGRIVEVFGPESSGKTTLCLSVIAQVQRAGGVAAFVDVEHALDPKWARTCGVNIDELLVSQPDSGDDALNITEKLIRSGGIDIVVVDSVAALVSKQELDGQMGDATVGSQARLMSQAMRRLTAVVNKTKCIVIFTNQIREKIGVMFGNPETTPGGRALKFFASVRLDVRKTGLVKDGAGTVTGSNVKVKVVKNKVAPPFTEGLFDIMYDEGISNSGTLIDYGVEHKLLEKKGAWIALDGQLIGQGREAAKKYLIENPAVGARLESELKKRLLKETVAATAPALPARDDAASLTDEQIAARVESEGSEAPMESAAAIA